jgi:hypothetical protein
MKKQTRRRLDDLPMGKPMLILSLIALVVVPILWVQGYLTSAVALAMLLAMLVLQAALIDLPGITYRQLHKLWGSKNDDDDGSGESPDARQG